MKTLKVARIAAAGAVAALTACSPPAPVLLKADGVERVRVDSAAFAAELKAFRASALELGGALLSDGGDGSNGNVVSSPGSLLIALAMLRAGATGDTAVEMDGMLGLPAAPRDEAMNALLASLENFDGDPGAVDEKNPPRKPVMHVANGLFVDKDVATGQEYLDTLARHYGTGVYPVDFPDERCHEACHGCLGGGEHRWPDQEGSGEIRSRTTPSACSMRCTSPPPGSSPFDPNDTSDLPFTTADGVEITAPAMHNELELKSRGGHGLARQLICRMPTASSCGWFCPMPVPARRPRRSTPEVDGNCGNLRHGAGGTVQIQLPRWDHKCSFDLRKVLRIPRAAQNT